MAAPFLIIDGYNLLHDAGLARARYAPGDLQRQRHRLLVRLASQMTASQRIRCTVVFEALEAPAGLDRRFRHGEITVMFAEPGHEADELIEALIASHDAAKQLVVVSSDHRLQKAARQRNAESLDSDVFLKQLAQAARDAKSDVDRSPSRAGNKSAETDYWIEQFGEIDVDALAVDESDAPVDPWKKDLDDFQRRLANKEELEKWLDLPPGQTPD